MAETSRPCAKSFSRRLSYITVLKQNASCKTLAVSPCLTPSCLKEHADDGHHCQSSVCKFGIQFFGLLGRVRCCQDLESKVSCCSRSSSRLVLGNFAVGHVCQDLSPSCGRGAQQKKKANTHQKEKKKKTDVPSCGWYFGNGSKAVRDIGEFQTCTWGQVTRELAGDLLGFAQVTQNKDGSIKIG